MKFRSKFQAVMCIATVMSLICTIVFFKMRAPTGNDLFSVLAITSLTCLYHFAVRLLIGDWLCARINVRRLNYNNWWFRPRFWEKSLYKKLGVRRWKGKMPTYNPSEFELTWSNTEEVVRSTCRAEIVHELNVLASFVPLRFAHYFGAFPAFLLTSIAAACLDLSFVMIQRYNRPRLIRLTKMRVRKGNNHVPNT